MILFLKRVFATFVLLCISVFLSAQSIDPFLCKITDSATGRPIPMVEFELENGFKLISDNDGYITVINPDLFGKTARFKIKGHGYTTGKKDFFGEESFVLKIKAGTEKTLQMKRIQISERLYRITGSGRYNHTIIGGKTPSFVSDDLLPGAVIGQDSVICVPWKDSLWLFYGDTLGLSGFNFSASCARIPLPKYGKYDWESAIPLKYITDENGFAAPMINTGKPGFTWIEYVLPVKTGKTESLLAKYVQHETLEKVAEAGFALFSTSRQNFKIVKRFYNSKPHKCMHPVPVKFGDQAGYLLSPWEFTEPDPAKIMKKSEHHFYSPLKEIRHEKGEYPSLQINGRRWKVNRNQNGRLVYSWRKNVPAIDSSLQQKLLERNLVVNSELLFAPVDLESGDRLKNFNGSIVFNSFLNCWITIVQGNKPGEIYFSRADTAVGPWIFAKKVSEFTDYNFYNPVIHPWFNKEQGRIIFYEGTYTNYFSASKCKTPEADYNQVMFKLDLGNSQLLIPVPVYLVSGHQSCPELLTAESLSEKNLWHYVKKIAFFAFPESTTEPGLFAPEDCQKNKFHFKVMCRNNLKKNWQNPKLRKLLRVFIPGDSAGSFSMQEDLTNGNNDAGVVINIPGQPLTIAPDTKPACWKEVRK
jgi:hypothetical protein